MSEETEQSDTQNYQKEATRGWIFSLKNLSPRMQMVFLGLSIMISASVFTLLGALLGSSIFGISIIDNPDILNQVNEPNVVSALKLMQIFQHLGLFIAPALLFAYMFGNKIQDYLRINRNPLPLTYLLAALIMLLALPVVNWMITLNEAMVLPEFLAGVEEWMKQAEESATGITEKFLIMDSTGDLVVNLLMIAILPAIGEELLFRGVIQRILISWTKNIHWGVWISAILFSAMHMQFYGFLPRMMLGVLFGYLFVWSGSLLLPMFCHLINNGAAVIFAYLSGIDELIAQEGELAATTYETLFTLASAITIAGLLYLIYKKEKANGQPIEV
ncbi:CPBP family intramembrane metalloprotease [Flavobacteriales bacterium AH-315-E23]|nr:CPBP family intramembrane metalloprotease [Flavobacteriales bacterium AH-315-E23]